MDLLLALCSNSMAKACWKVEGGGLYRDFGFVHFISWQ